MAQLTCGTCGAPINLENPYVKSATCPFCGASYLITADKDLQPRGQGIKLADYPSLLSIDQRGQIGGNGFSVLGRIRYAYDEGFWEEWQIEWDDGKPPAWLEEDEGNWTLYTRQTAEGEIPPFERVGVGSVIRVNGRDVFITEKRNGRMIGQEGQFSTVLPVKAEFGFVAGVSNGEPVSVTYWSDETEVEFGKDLEPNQIKITS